MFIQIHTCLSAPKMFAKFGCQTQFFCNKKEKKMVSKAWVRQTIGINMGNQQRNNITACCQGDLVLLFATEFLLTFQFGVSTGLRGHDP